MRCPSSPCRTRAYLTWTGRRGITWIIVGILSIQNLRHSAKLSPDSNRICKLFILYDSERNPFRHLLSYALEDSTLQQCILALAARHFANTGKSFDQANLAVSLRFAHAKMDAIHFKRQTIGALSRQLTHPELGKKDPTMATILLLIFLDLLESGIDGWDYHLQGAKSLVTLYQSLTGPCASSESEDPGDTAHEMRRFIDRQFSLYVISRWLLDAVSPLTISGLQHLEQHSPPRSRGPNSLSVGTEISIKSPLFGAFSDVQSLF